MYHSKLATLFLVSGYSQILYKLFERICADLGQHHFSLSVSDLPFFFQILLATAIVITKISATPVTVTLHWPKVRWPRKVPAWFAPHSPLLPDWWPAVCGHVTHEWRGVCWHATTNHLVRGSLLSAGMLLVKWPRALLACYSSCWWGWRLVSPPQEFHAGAMCSPVRWKTDGGREWGRLGEAEECEKNISGPLFAAMLLISGQFAAILLINSVAGLLLY